jgi:hypothetical protein
MSGNVDTTGAQKMIAAKTAQRNQEAAGFTPQFSSKAKKVIQRIIDPTGANVGRQAVPAVTPSGKRMANDSFIRAIAAGPQPNPLSGAKMGALGFKKGGKTTTLHSITKSSKKSNW